MKPNTFFIVLGCLFLTLATSGFGQTILLREDFDGQWQTALPPFGWTIAFSGDTSTNDWYRAPLAPVHVWQDNPTPYSLIDSAGGEQGDDSLISPLLNCAGFSSVSLRCSTYFSGSPERNTAQLLGSIAGGPFEQVVFDYTGQRIGPELQIFALPWAAGQQGVRLAWVFSGLSTMMPYWAIDNVVVVGTPVSVDAACTGILAPPAIVDSSAIVDPQVSVSNRGLGPASFLAYLRIAAGAATEYYDSAIVENLAAGASRNVTFRQWTAGARGNRTVTAYVVLTGDENPSDDTLLADLHIRVADVGAAAILTPADTVDSGTVLTPQALVINFGSDSSTFFTFCRFDNSAARDSTLIQSLAPGESVVVEFRPWTAAGIGSHMIRCSTALASDVMRGNDATGRSFYVQPHQFRDAAAIAVLAPAGTVPESLPVIPVGLVTYAGRGAPSVRIRLVLRSGDSLVYSDSDVVVMQPDVIDTVTFSPWLATPVGDYISEMLVQMTGDDDPANDLISDSFAVGTATDDVGAVSILAPAGRIYAGAAVPRTLVRNFGSRVETFWARFSITNGAVLLYRDSAQAVSLAPGDTTTLTFRSWMAAAGTYSARCSTRLPGDDVDTNNRVQSTFAVDTLNFPRGWHEAESVPFQPGAKDVKGGGSLTTMAATGMIYALKGNKTGDFFAYDAIQDSWRAMPPVPLEPTGKPVDYGGTLANDGNRYLYATKGNNTRSFYRFDLVSGLWYQLDSVPFGLSGKKVKGGASSAFVSGPDGDYVYLLKGYKNEFYRYQVASDSWKTLPPAPPAASEKYDKGSFIVWDGTGTIYCHQAKYHKFYAFDVATQSWRTTHLDSMPILNGRGKSKKSKDGAAAVWSDGCIYALKGGGTNEFWKYFAAQDSWKELDTIPSWGSTLKKKFVKAGGAIAAFSSDIFFVFKGNKTHEFWRYRFGGTTAVAEPAVTGARPATTAAVRLWPNPARSSVTVHVPSLGPTRAATSIRIYDTRGVLRHEQPVTAGLVQLDCRSLTAGVYFVRAIGVDRAAQLIIE
jgi:hypothetical protein